MIDIEEYKNVIKNMMEFRYKKVLKKNEFIIMIYLLSVLKSSEPTEVKQKRIADFTGLSKSEVSKSMKRLLETGILIRMDDCFKFGLQINGDIVMPKEEDFTID